VNAAGRFAALIPVVVLFLLQGFVTRGGWPAPRRTDEDGAAGSGRRAVGAGN
jgi:hypothetical protein